MDRRIYHGNIQPGDLANALAAEFHRGNMQVQTVGTKEKLAVQIATRKGARAGGQAAMTVTLQAVEDGVLVEVGQLAWLGVAASLGQTAFSALAALRNPFHLLGRLDDLAQDLESIQLSDTVWRVIDRAAANLGASYQLSERLSRVCCEYCGTANPLGEGSCTACGAPLGTVHPTTCSRCGYVLAAEEQYCPNCRQKLS